MTQTPNADFHNHIIPGVDDGASDEDQSREALRAFVAQGITNIITTPHVEGSLTLRPKALSDRLRQIDDAWVVLERIRAEEFPDVRLYRGAEVMLDTPSPELNDDRLRLAGHPFALVEYPYMRVPPNSDGVLHFLVKSGVTPIIAHPERYHGITPDSKLPAEWKRAGALLQMNAGSINGRYGAQPRSNAFALLKDGLIDYLCSDYHARGEPATASTRDLLCEMGADELAELLGGVNPRRLLEGKMPLPVPPLVAQRSVIGKLRRWLG